MTTEMTKGKACYNYIDDEAKEKSSISVQSIAWTSAKLRISRQSTDA
jgi:hypothetical protein